MPSTRKQKAKARKSSEMDMMSDFENIDVMLGNKNINTIEREHSNVLGNTGDHCDTESNLQPEENETRENDFGNFVRENAIPGQDMLHETMETFTSEFNMRLSHVMDSMIAMMHSQINRAINTAMAGRVIPEIQNMVSSLSSSGNRDNEASSSPNSQENTGTNSGFKSKITKKHQWSVGDLRAPTDSSPYMVTGAFDTQRQYPEFLTGRIHSHPTLERQELAQTDPLDTTLPVPEPEVPQTPQSPLNRLADVLVILQNKPQSMTIRPVTTTPMTFDGKSEKFEFFEDLYHTMIKM